jgi:hypothetical protein
MIWVAMIMSPCVNLGAVGIRIPAKPLCRENRERWLIVGQCQSRRQMRSNGATEGVVILFPW